MAKKFISMLICVAVVLGAGMNCFAYDYGYTRESTAKAVYLVCRDTGQVIYEKNANERLHPASTTKIMAAALAMSLCEDTKHTIVTVPEGVWNEFDGLNVSSAGLLGGEQLMMYDLLCCMMLCSANEAASAVAEYFGRAEFIDKMNEKAAELGCTDTHFTHPSGVFSDDHYTSARDMYLITEWALTIPGFWEMSQLTSYTVPATNKSEPRDIVTTIYMQSPLSGYYTSYIKGIKTGTTDEAGRCLVTAAQKNGMTYILVVLGAPLETSSEFWGAGNSVFTETRLIYDWAFDNLSLINVTDEMAPVAELKLRYAAKRDSLILYPGGELYTVENTAYNTDRSVEYVPTLPEYVNAPIANGQVIGTADVMYNGEKLGTVDLVAREDIELSSFAFVIDNLAVVLSSTTAKIIYAVLILAALLYIYYMTVVVRRARKKNKRKKR